MDRYIRSTEDILTLLDGLFEPEADRWTPAGADWWDGFYADRSKPVPFFVSKPDENLVSYAERKLITAPGRALDLGCGPGRNALYLASLGFDVDAVDLSPTAIDWAKGRAAEDGGAGAAGTADGSGGELRFHCGDAFAMAGVTGGTTAPGDNLANGSAKSPGKTSATSSENGSGDGRQDAAAPELTGPYDLIYDSGCFHHLPPHRRITYLAFLDRLLGPGGLLGLACFSASEMGAEFPDHDFYRRQRLEGGLAYTPTSLRWIFSELEEVELRRMKDEDEDSAYFGEPFLWTMLLRKKG